LNSEEGPHTPDLIRKKSFRESGIVVRQSSAEKIPKEFLRQTNSYEFAGTETTQPLLSNELCRKL